MDSIPYSELFLMLRDNGSRLNDYKNLLKRVLAKTNFNFSENAEMHLQEPLRKFCVQLYEKWIRSHRIYNKFVKNNKSWLTHSFQLPSEALKSIPMEMELCEPSTSTTAVSQRVKRSHNKKSFSELCNRQKKRRTETLRTENSANELMFAAKMKMQTSGNRDIAEIISFLMENPEQASKIREFCEGKYIEKKPLYSKDKTLAIMLALKLSQNRYITLRKLSIEDGMNRYPSYHKVLLAKKDCYTPQEDIFVMETYAQIKLQALLDLTTQRLLKACNIETHELQNLILICKWGFDGASGQSLYKQKFTEISNHNDCSKPTDSSIFMSCLVPLRLVNGLSVLWENAQPSSTKYCRPIKFQFISENTAIIKAEHDRIQMEIANLTPTHISENIKVSYQLLLTMVDGKICSTLAESSSMKCYICGATPKEMNNLYLISKKPLETEHYKFGMSSLHARIRCMEFLLNVSYNLHIKKWSVRDAQQKIHKQERKKKIQDDFRRKLGLLIDVVKQGVGTTNDGNTARLFFENPSVTAEITELDEIIITKFAVILQVIASGQQINTEKFDAYAKNLAQLVVDKYGWYYMPASVHKILLHGAEIINHAIVPIGQLSEEALEARHKEFRKFRLEHSRKMSRKETNMDIMHMLLITSDPYICSLIPNVKQIKKKKIFPEAANLLIETVTGNEECDEESLDN